MRKTPALLLAAFAMATLFIEPAAADGPSLMPVQGHLSDAQGVPIDGARDLSIVVFDAPAGGSAIHSETFPAQPIVDGNFVVYLGSGQSLDLAHFRDHDDLWLEITVDSEIIQPRLRLATAPYAGHAKYCDDADTLDGNSASSFAPVSHGHAWSTVTAVPPDLADGDADTLGALGVTCSSGQVPRWSGTQWQCGPVAFSAVDWPAGFSFLSASPCPAGFIAVEGGYVKLSSSPSLVPTPRTLVTPGHFHSPGTLAVQPAGAHDHTLNDYHYLDSGNDPSYATGSGDDVGQLTVTNHATSTAADHAHTLGGTIGASGSGIDGDGDLPAAGELEHVALRLCIKN